MNTAQIIATISSLVGAVFASTGFWNWIASKSKKRSSYEYLIIALAHDRIYFLCKKFLRDGEISHDDYNTLNHLYKGYEACGGNSTAKEYMEKVHDLPYSD